MQLQHRRTRRAPWRAIDNDWRVRSFDPIRVGQLEWAPQPDNDPEGARRCMREFYALVARRHGEGGVEPSSVEEAADLRTLAMRHSDRWVVEGRDPASPLIPLERGELIRSYSSLRVAVQ
jgi:hypothetical protein